MPQPGVYYALGDPLVLGVKTFPELVDIYRSVSDSIRDILTTQVGTRPMRPAYGCNVFGFIFETIDDLLIARAEIAVRRALEINEPRIQVQDVNVTTEDDQDGHENVIVITVGYYIRRQYLETTITYQRQGAPP